MAEPYDINHPEFGKREEDWPDPDVDSDTEEGAAAIARSEATMAAMINRSVDRRYKQTNTFEHIPKSLYTKARDHQDQLTADERQVLLGRGDVIGRVLAAPDSLTLEEMHVFLNWPSPDVVRANIQRHTGGQLSTPPELFAKAQDAIDQKQFLTMLSPGERTLMAMGFHDYSNPDAWETCDNGSHRLAHGPFLHIPGFNEAIGLLQTRLGVVRAIQRRASVYGMPDSILGTDAAMMGDASEPTWYELMDGIFNDVETLEQQRALGTVSEEEFTARKNELDAAMARGLAMLRPQSPEPEPAKPFVYPTLPLPFAPPPLLFPPTPYKDSVGAGPWPPLVRMVSPINLFQEDRKDRPREESTLGVWHELTEEQREAYRARSEELRVAAWAEHERKVVATSGRYQGRLFETSEEFGVPETNERGILPPRPTLIGNLGLFREEVMPGSGREQFQRLLGKWDELPQQQREAYDQKAENINKINTQEHYEIMRAIPSEQRRAAHLAWGERLRAANSVA